MDRQELVNLLNDLISNPGYYGDSTKADMILNYCIEKGKPPQLSIKFVQLLCMNSMLLHSRFMDMLEVLKKDHNICTVQSKVNPALLDGRALLFNY